MPAASAPTDAELRDAWDLCRTRLHRNMTFEQAQADPAISRVLNACAIGRRHRGARPARLPAPASQRHLHEGRSPLIDFKRAASGDCDD
jgi:hypothetical protein